ncbi:MAG: hypothetical protein FH762_01355 [Firmicutes bacterium]|nr:hypothetical protein [Bacillota bacterium]
MGWINCCIKYCGGCNSRINRREIVKRVKADLCQFDFSSYSVSKKCDILIFISGCHVGCAMKLYEEEFDIDKVIEVKGLSINNRKVNKNELVEKLESKIIKKYKDSFQN